MLRGIGNYGYARSHRLLEVVAIFCFFVVEAWMAVRLWADVSNWKDVAGLAIAALIGYALADLISGLVHWIGDTLFDARTPFVGPHFVKPFREHHLDPAAICRHDFIETNGNNCIVIAPGLIVVAAVVPTDSRLWFLFVAVVASVSFAVFMTNQFHKWAHAASVPGWVRLLQRSGLILSTKHHDIHHAHPHDKYYCITVGWWNGLLTRMVLFRRLEDLVRRYKPDILHVDERSRAPQAARL